MGDAQLNAKMHMRRERSYHGMNALLHFVKTFNFILKKYNSGVDATEGIISVFNKVSSIAKAKGVKYDAIFSEIGKSLHVGVAPTILQLYHASYFVKQLH